jgi:hypothetical protein
MIFGAVKSPLALYSVSHTIKKATAVSVKSKTLYHIEWGCPIGGEDTYTISGIANPEFIKDMEQYKEAVRKVILKLKEELKQTTVTLEFLEVDIEYLK